MEGGQGKQTGRTNTLGNRMFRWFSARCGRTQIIVLLLITVGVVVWAVKVVSQSYFYSYTRHIIETALSDPQRRREIDLLMAQHEWRLFEYERKFAQKLCEDVPPREGIVWLTVLVNDAYLIPTIVLGHSIQTYSCHKHMLVLITATVSPSSREILQKVGWSLREVQPMDCNWMDVQFGRKQKNKGITGTHTRFHAWNLTQFSRIVYADPDYMPLTNIDELFDHPGDFAAVYCSRPGVVEPCFNAGLLSFKPNKDDYQNIMNFWKEKSVDHCSHDQLILWHYFADSGRWSPLPFPYNVRRMIFRPMKGFHFVCCPPSKPWSSPCRPSRVEAKEFNQPIINVRDVSLMFWRKFYEALDKYDLETWWRSHSLFDAAQEFGTALYKGCWREHGISWRRDHDLAKEEL